jgi:ribosomal protein S18 acetylase RimI-like enzyme
MSAVQIIQGSVDDVAALQPLWLAIHRQHQEAMPGLAPYVSDEVSWQHRAALYNSLFERYSPHLLLAKAGTELVGYGLAYAMPAEDTWLADTWSTGELIGEIESLGVLPGRRGGGVGTRLLAALQEHLAGLGVRDVILGALPANQNAIRFYRRHGFTQTWLYLSKLDGRPS